MAKQIRKNQRKIVSSKKVTKENIPAAKDLPESNDMPVKEVAPADVESDIEESKESAIQENSENSKESSEDETSDTSSISFNSEEKEELNNAVKDMEDISSVSQSKEGSPKKFKLDKKVEYLSESCSKNSKAKKSQVKDSDAEVIDEEVSESVSLETGSGSGDENEDDVAKTVFIKGLDYDVTEDQIKGEMGKIGTIVRVNVPLKHDGSRNKGFAYVEFEKLSGASLAKKMNGTMLLGRRINVDSAKPKENRLIYTVFCKNLSFNTKKEEIEKYFSKFGKVFNISLPIDLENEGRNKGFAFVEFTDEKLAAKVASEKHCINNRQIYCNMGNKNEDRNKKRSDDRLYGRSGGNMDRREGNGDRRNNDSFRNNHNFNDSGDRRNNDGFRNKHNFSDNGDRRNNDGFKGKNKFDDNEESKQKKVGKSKKIVFNDESD